MRKRLTALVLLAAITPLCLPDLFHIDGAVLCIGEDGHVAVEESRRSLCCSDEALPAGDESLDDSCGSCVDFPICLEDQDHHNIWNQDRGNPAPDFAAFEARLDDAATPGASFLRVSGDPVHPFRDILSSLRTVVLLM